MCVNWMFMNGLGVDKIDYGEYIYKEYYDSYVEGGFDVTRGSSIKIYLRISYKKRIRCR